VWLKNDSELDYPDQFAGEKREVYLSGEAFFDVVKDPKKPFIIHSKNLTTKVLGTTFNIRAYDHEESKEVAVVTGRVLVSVNQGKGKSREVVLNPRQKIIYNQKDNLIIETEAKINSSAELDQQIELKFVEMSLNEIIGRISQKFDVEIEIKNDQINNCKITADLSDEPLDHCLEIVTQATNSNYIIHENKIIIDGNGCDN
ncbi:MAG: FecR family protein, partial [Cyclobacteriaceae bacterium]